MILLCCILGICFGLIRGGKLQHVWRKRFRLWPLLFVSVACQWLVSAAWLAGRMGDTDGYLTLRIALSTAQYVLVLVFLCVNYRKPGLLLVALGSSLNGLVIVANQGRMPIGPAVLRFGEAAVERIAGAPHYFLAEGSEPFFLLGDNIPLLLYMISIGDILIGLGMFFLGAYLTKRIVRPKAKTVDPARNFRYTGGR